jgi:hypothetical protein
MSEQPVLSAFVEAVDHLVAASPDAAHASALSDSLLIEATRITTRALRQAQATFAVLAAETAARSAPSRGSAGLAQSGGYRTPELMLRATTGSTAREAATAVRVGTLVRSPQHAWLSSVGQSLAHGSLSVAAAEAIQSGLGSPNEFVSAAQLADAASRLCVLAANLDPDRLFRRARDERDELDASAVVDREKRQRAARSLRFVTKPDGMGRITWELDPEGAAPFRDLYDRATSPRRGGPRFVADDNRAHTDAVAHDQRTTEQLASDVLFELLAHGAEADSHALLSTGAPVVRIVVSAAALDAREGFGVIEGSSEAVSIATVERTICSATTVRVTVDPTGEVLDLGREHRLHTRRQRRALATRDGGCRWPGCDRPPSWCEAHHIKHWARDHGGTSMHDGILLCRHHHLLAHNNGWEIENRGGSFEPVPPASVDPLQRRVAMPTRSRVVAGLISRPGTATVVRSGSGGARSDSRGARSGSGGAREPAVVARR